MFGSCEGGARDEGCMHFCNLSIWLFPHSASGTVYTAVEVATGQQVWWSCHVTSLSWSHHIFILVTWPLCPGHMTSQYWSHDSLSGHMISYGHMTSVLLTWSDTQLANTVHHMPVKGLQAICQCYSCMPPPSLCTHRCLLTWAMGHLLIVTATSCLPVKLPATPIVHLITQSTLLHMNCPFIFVGCHQANEPFTTTKEGDLFFALSLSLSLSGSGH